MRQIHQAILWNSPRTSEDTLVSTSTVEAILKTCKYLGCLLNIRNIGTYPKRPLNMDLILIKLQQKHDQNKQSIEHEERKYRFISQFYKFASNPGLEKNHTELVKLWRGTNDSLSQSVGEKKIDKQSCDPLYLPLECSRHKLCSSSHQRAI